MLLIAITALSTARVVQQQRSARREAELLSRLNGAEGKVLMLKQQNILKKWQSKLVRGDYCRRLTRMRG